jgi:hypothetical protein
MNIAAGRNTHPRARLRSGCWIGVCSRECDGCTGVGVRGVVGLIVYAVNKFAGTALAPKHYKVNYWLLVLGLTPTISLMYHARIECMRRSVVVIDPRALAFLLPPASN